MIRVLQLINGRIIVGRILSNGADEIMLERPCMLQQVQGPNGQPATAIVPYAPWSPDKEIPIKQHCVESITGAGDLEQSWLEATSGISLTSNLPPNVSQFRR